LFNLRGLGVNEGARLLDCLLRHELALDEIFGPLDVALILRQLRLKLHEQCLRRMQLRFRLQECRSLGSILQTTQHLPRLHVIALPRSTPRSTCP